LWLYAPYALLAVHKRIQNIIPAPAGISYNRPEWWVPKEFWVREGLVP
jgi:peptide/nickel transport system substrate-binding protein